MITNGDKCSKQKKGRKEEATSVGAGNKGTWPRMEI